VAKPSSPDVGAVSAGEGDEEPEASPGIGTAGIEGGDKTLGPGQHTPSEKDAEAVVIWAETVVR
jgi:hypothetical protein